MQREYERHLPHQVPEGVPIFLTWNLKGAMPRDVHVRLQREREQLERQPPRAGESPRDRALRHGKLIFAKSDEFLDRAEAGPLHLKDPAAAKIVEEAILFGTQERHALLAWCVMANHVHVLLTPLWPLAKVTQGLKGFTAHEINRLQNEVGRTFWVDESYDHWARDEEELLRIIVYIENNPVKAGLCEKPEDWQWSSARFRQWWPRGEVLKAEWIARCKPGESGWKA
jgi:REP element-mobilizing transposase RayT